MLLRKIGLAIGVLLTLTATAWISAENGTSSYFVYSVLALMAFGLELADGSTLGFVFVILALPGLQWAETLLMAGSAIFINAVIRRARPAPDVFLRSLGTTSLAIAATQLIYNAPNLAPLMSMPIRLLLASGLCFLTLRVFNLGKTERWSFPYYVAAAMAAYLIPVSVVLVPLFYLAWRSCRLYERRLERQRRESERAASLHLRTIETLALAIEAREQPLMGPSRRVQIYCVEMAKELGLDDLEIEALRAASLLYDIGELAVPENIIGKSGPLTHEEFEKIKIHPSVGAEILERVKFPYPVAPIVLAHHEHWDGTGYPHGLNGEEIPIGARILALVDALDALASPRHHRPALTLAKALNQVEREAGRAFDPRLTALLTKRSKQWETLVQSQSDESFIDSIFSARREEQIVFQLAHTLGSSLDLKETFAALASGLRALTSFDTCAVWVQREDGLTAEFAGGDHLELYSALKIPLGAGVSGWVAANGKAIANQDAALELGHLGFEPPPSPSRLALSVPLAAGDLSGALTIYRSTNHLFTAEDVRMVSALAPKVAVAVANGLRFRQTALAAATDALTGLPNTASLGAHIATISHSTAFVVCDLDGFKGVNDRFGHVTGNRLLQTLADHFRLACRGRDFVARVGGDEFVLVLEGIEPTDLSARIAQFRQAVHEVGLQICGEQVLDASFGAAFYPTDGATSDELLAFADRQMYRQKELQRSGVVPIQRRKAAG